MLFLGADGVANQDNPGLLPCRNAEVVVQTRMPPDETNDGDVSQLVVQCIHPFIAIIFVLFINTYLQSDNLRPLMEIAKPVSF